jgi:hypothetical protein
MKTSSIVSKLLYWHIPTLSLGLKAFRGMRKYPFWFATTRFPEVSVKSQL